MLQDNYYTILGVPFHANTIEIKKAYRRKAKLYHPDTHHHDENKTAKFQLIQIAYETLSSSIKRNEYNRSIFTNQVNIKIKYFDSAEAVIESVRAMHQSLSLQNQFFIDRDWLLNECSQILSEQHQQLFKHNNSLKHLLFKEQIKCLDYLPFKIIQQFQKEWIAFANDDQKLIESINTYFTRKKNESLWENNKTLIAVLIGTIITILIMKG